MKNNRYEPGDVAGGILIIGDAHPDNDNSYHKYEGTWACCGKPIVMTHKTLLDRIRTNRSTCVSCTWKSGRAKQTPRRPRETTEPERQAPYNVALPEWPTTTAGRNWKLR